MRSSTHNAFTKSLSLSSQDQSSGAAGCGLFRHRAFFERSGVRPCAAGAAVCTALGHRRTAAICSGRIWDRRRKRRRRGDRAPWLPLHAAGVRACLHCKDLTYQNLPRGDKEEGKGLMGACALTSGAQWLRAVRCSGALCARRSVHASTGRLRAGRSFLAKVDLLIGRWPGWRVPNASLQPLQQHISSLEPSHHFHGSPLLVAATHREWSASGPALLRRSTTEVSSSLDEPCCCCCCSDFGGRPSPKLVPAGGGGSSLETSKDEEERVPPTSILRLSRWSWFR